MLAIAPGVRCRRWLAVALPVLLQACAVSGPDIPPEPSTTEPSQLEFPVVDEQLPVEESPADADPVPEAVPPEADVAVLEEPAEQEPVAAPPEPPPSFQKGDVRWIQQRLKEFGYYAGPIDGRVGGATRNAIRAYQADQGLVQDGKPTPSLQDFIWRNGG